MGLVFEEIKYNGKKYRRYPEAKQPSRQKYFRATTRDKTRLHRQVWMDAFGEIPEGHHIHHRDGDTGNNAINNLECLSALEHLKEHGTAPRTPAQLKALSKARRASCDSPRRKTAEYRENMRQAAKKKWADWEPVEKQCVQCGYSYMANHPRGLYCSRSCQNRAAYLRKKA